MKHSYLLLFVCTFVFKEKEPEKTSNENKYTLTLDWLKLLTQFVDM